MTKPAPFVPRQGSRPHTAADEINQQELYNGTKCATRMVAEMPQAHVEVEQFINEQKPDVVVYDVPMPYSSSWDLLDVIRAMPSLQSQRL